MKGQFYRANYYKRVMKNDLSESVLDYKFNNNNMEKGKWFNSSADATALSITIKGILIAWIPMIIAIGQFFDLAITQETLTELIQSLTAIISSVMIVFGIIRKIYYKIEK
jgi:hypothetical protein